jgi:hypothetical protein
MGPFNGDARVREDRALWLQDVAYVTQQVYGEIEQATRAFTEVCTIPSTFQEMTLIQLLEWRLTKCRKFCRSISRPVANYHTYWC